MNPVPQARWLFLLRAFFPSWKFFVKTGPEIKLEARHGPDESHISEWASVLAPIRRTFFSAATNPSGNYLHACHNTLHHLAVEIAKGGDVGIETRACYKITRNLVRFELREKSRSPLPAVYQFRLRLHYPTHFERVSDIVLISPVYGFDEPSPAAEVQ